MPLQRVQAARLYFHHPFSVENIRNQTAGKPHLMPVFIRFHPIFKHGVEAPLRKSANPALFPQMQQSPQFCLFKSRHPIPPASAKAQPGRKTATPAMFPCHPKGALFAVFSLCHSQMQDIPFQRLVFIREGESCYFPVSQPPGTKSHTISA